MEETVRKLQLHFEQSFLVFWTKPYFLEHVFSIFGILGPTGVGWVGGGVAGGGRRGGSRPQLPPASRQLASVTAQV